MRCKSDTCFLRLTYEIVGYECEDEVKVEDEVGRVESTKGKVMAAGSLLRRDDRREWRVVVGCLLVCSRLLHDLETRRQARLYNRVLV